MNLLNAAVINCSWSRANIVEQVKKKFIVILLLNDVGSWSSSFIVSDKIF